MLALEMKQPFSFLLLSFPKALMLQNMHQMDTANASEGEGNKRYLFLTAFKHSPLVPESLNTTPLVLRVTATRRKRETRQEGQCALTIGNLHVEEGQ